MRLHVTKNSARLCSGRKRQESRQKTLRNIAQCFLYTPDGRPQAVAFHGVGISLKNEK